ncbi:right-handed parallel beta-helix repeat-containing protein [Rhodothermus marinus]|uniref:right-handed parallel beta-helix repeat-containing protein n=1 Tax=Rhodothermus marinus TaxID=29549 RepID=UPI000AF1C38F|nr:right-handed parallel beta-helix repeat-containing protein [Rhodothermus marinus]
MKQYILGVLLLSWAAVAYGQRAYFVAPDGNDTTGDGSQTAPWATLNYAIARVTAGDTIYLRGGQYNWTSRVNINNAGTPEAYIYIWAYPGETPVLNFEGNPDEGIRLRGWYVHIKGLVVQRAGDNGIRINGSYNIIEQVVVRENGDSGLQLDSGAAHNLILNVDSYRNYDAANHGENADGFAAKFGLGPGNVFRGCRAFENSDDGFDFWEAGEGVRVEDSWSFDNGYNRWNDPSFEGDSNGFKLGHGEGAHVLIRNLAWGHRAHGFDVNGNQTGVTLYNNTAYRNLGRNFYFDEHNSAHVLRNNLSVEGQELIYPEIDDAYNNWNLGILPHRTIFSASTPRACAGPGSPTAACPDSTFCGWPRGAA